MPLRILLEAADIQPGVVDILLHAADGYTDTLPLEKAMDPSTLVAYEMNGEPLPERHGYPARVIVPGLFGKNHVKWVRRIELINTHVKGFYEQQGWGPSFVIPTTSRFDRPAHEQVVSMSADAVVPLKGVAFAGARGVSRVEVSFDDGQSWQDARIDYRGAPLAWIFWSYPWTARQPGTYKLVVRATDATGMLQTATEHNSDPEGATGYHRITVRVEA